MKKLLTTFYLILLTTMFNDNLYAKSRVTQSFIETNSLTQIEQAITRSDKQTLIIFDVQEVLMVAKDQVLTPLYRAEYHLWRDKIIANSSPEERDRIFSIILNEYGTEIIDPKVRDLIATAKSKRAKIIALTSGYTGKFGVIENREDLRLSRLSKIGIDFSDSFSTVPYLKLDYIAKNDPDSKYSPIFKQGIIFASRLPKGEILKDFLSKVKFKPKKIIFMDNKLKNIESVQKFAADAGINFEGFYYNAVKHRAKLPFNQKRANYQFKILEEDGKWLSDAEADLQLMKKIK